MSFQAYAEEIVFDRNDCAPGDGKLNGSGPATDQRVSDFDWAKFRKIVKDDVRASAEDIKASMPKPISPWVVAASAVGLTAFIIGTLGSMMIYAIDKDARKRAMILTSIEKSLDQNTKAVGHLTKGFVDMSLTTAKLDGTVTDLNGKFQGLRLDVRDTPRDHGRGVLLKRLQR